MKFVIVNQHPAVVTGGSEIQCGLIAEGLRGKGHDVVYVAPLRDMADALPLKGEVRWVPMRSGDIVSAVLDEKPDAVYWRFNLHGFRAVARRLYGNAIPIVFAVSHINDVTPWAIKPVWGIRGKLLSPLKRLVARFEYDGYRYVSELTVNNSSHLGRAPVSSQHFIPNGMVAGAVPFSWPRPYFAWVGNIKRSKRPEVAVRLASRLVDAGVDVLMAGNIQSGHYRWMDDPAALPANCHYLGGKSLEEVNGILAGSLLHIHTCEPEGFSNVFIQAWLQGKPSVSYGFDPAGYIAANELGLDAGGDFSVFLEAAERLMQDEEERERMGARARAFAEQTFSVEKLVERVEAVLVEAVGKGTGED